MSGETGETYGEERGGKCKQLGCHDVQYGIEDFSLDLLPIVVIFFRYQMTVAKS